MNNVEQFIANIKKPSQHFLPMLVTSNMLVFLGMFIFEKRNWIVEHGWNSVWIYCFLLVWFVMFAGFICECVEAAFATIKHYK